MHIENLLFILLIAMAVLFRLLASKVGEARKRQQDPDQRSTTHPPPPEPIERAPVESDSERIRRFLEALGQPAGSRPPPVVVPRTDIPPRPMAPVQLPTGQFAPPWKLAREGRRQRKAISRESPPLESAERAEKIFLPAITGAPAFEVHEGPLSPEPPPSVTAAAAQPAAQGEEPKTHVGTLLASTSGLRDAIVLREIFGPPRGLRPPEFIGS
jgi:hypothetical protein